MGFVPLSDGYIVLPADNGGWLVKPAIGAGVLGAFTTYRDLIDWLEATHIDMFIRREEPLPLDECARLVPRDVPVTRHTNINSGSEPPSEEA
jgi:hypothetical protein